MMTPRFHLGFKNLLDLNAICGFKEITVKFFFIYNEPSCNRIHRNFNVFKLLSSSYFCTESLIKMQPDLAQHNNQNIQNICDDHA